MILQSFEYIPADTLQVAERLLKEHGNRAAVLAGGTDLLGALKDAIHDDPPAVLIGLKGAAGARYVTVEPAGLRIGALTTLAEIAQHSTIRRDYPLLAEAARSVASPQIRNVATLAGNLCQEPRCWYYRNPDNTFDCLRKGGATCDALFAENRYHSIFGGMCVSAAPCVTGCPIHNDIPTYMAQLREGKLAEAVAILMRTNPLPAITGRACAHPCESSCNRYGYDEPVSIRDVERTLGDYALAHAAEIYTPPAGETGKRVAVVGAGPAGLTAAYFLRQLGHAVTVYDRMPEAGGMLTYSIPAYRLPKAVVREQVAALARTGIRFELGAAVGDPGLMLSDLRAQHDGVFLATGLWTGKKLRLAQDAVETLHATSLLDSGLDFLIDIQRGVARRVGQRVLVIGGGSVAVDVAITARRLGAAEVTMACLESLAEMPAIPEDIEQAHEEGITILPSWGPQRVLARDGKLVGMELVRCTAVFDQDGRFAPTFDPTVTTVFEADQVLIAIGQAADLSYLEQDFPDRNRGFSRLAGLSEKPAEASPPEGQAAVLKTARGFIVTDKRTLATSLAGVFAGGDVTGGPATLVNAMAAGRQAAAALDAYLAAAPLAAPLPATGKVRLTINQAALPASARVTELRLPAAQRTLRGEDRATLPAEAATAESFRCANCGCVAVNASDLAPALIALDARIQTTQRSLAAEELFAATAGGTTVLAPDELIEEVEIPAAPPGSRQVYLKFRIRNAIDFPIVGVAFRAAMVDGRFHDARVVLGAVAPVPLRVRAVEALLEGREPGEALAQEAGALAVRDAQPLAHNKFKIAIVKGLVGRLVGDSPERGA